MSFFSWLPSRHRRAPGSAVLPDEDIETQLQLLCTPPLSGKGTGNISHRNIQGLEILLEILDAGAGRRGPLRWCTTPRTYGILRNIGALEFMDEFRSKFNDFYLPYNERTLPSFLQRKDGRDLRQAFLDAQGYFLADAKLMETDGASKHFLIPGSGDNYFRPIRTLGQGSFGGVDLVYSRLSLRNFARKRVLRGRDSDRSRDNQSTLISELSHLKQLRHRHLVKIVASYTDPEYISYIMEPVAELDLEHLLARPRDISSEYQCQSSLRRFFGCLAGAVNYLHQSKIRHRDITARNILIYRDEVYISDFGSAYNWSNRSVSATRHQNTPVSPDYQAPEIAKREERDSKSDMFSLGVVFLEMSTRLLGRSVAELKLRIKVNARKHNSDQSYVYANLPVVTAWLDELTKANTVEHDNEPLVWVRDLLQEKPRNRPSAKGLMKDILESPSFRSFCCFECQREFEERGFEYDAGLQRHELLEDSTATKTTVAHMFGDESSKNGMSLQKSESVEKWLGVTSLDSDDKFIMPGAFPDIQNVRVGGGPGVDESNSFPSTIHAHDWHSTSELHEGDQWYTQRILASEPDERAFQSSQHITPPAGYPESASFGQAVSGYERTVCDTGLGFMEYGSSDSDDDVEQQMFEEYSDPSDTSSESEPASAAHRASGVASHVKELGIIPELDEIQSEEDAPENDRNVYQFEEFSDDSATNDETKKRDAGLQIDKSESVSHLLDSFYPTARHPGDRQLALPVVAGYIETPCTGMRLVSSATTRPQAVTCEDDPEDTIADAIRDPSPATLGLDESILIGWPIEQGVSSSDEANQQPEQFESPFEILTDVPSSYEGDGQTASPSSIAAHAVSGEYQIEYGSALILSGRSTLDSSGPSGCNTNTGPVPGEAERAVRFALPPPPKSHTAESTLGMADLPLDVSSLRMIDEFGDVLPNSAVNDQPQQLEQAPAPEQRLRWRRLCGVPKARATKILKGPPTRQNRGKLAVMAPQDSRWEIELAVHGSYPPAGNQKPQKGSYGSASIPADRTSHVRGKMDEGTEMKIQPESGIFYETSTRGVFSRQLLPSTVARQEPEARQPPQFKANSRLLGTGNAMHEKGQPLQSTSVSRPPLTAANLKALGGTKSRPSTAPNMSSLQLQPGRAKTLPVETDLPIPVETKQYSGRTRSSVPRSPRQRTELPPINAKLMMNAIWDSASASAPTSVMSEATKATLSKILVPFDQYDRMHNLLRDYCKQGKATAVKFLLQRGCNPGTKKHPRRAPLLAAVQGASEKHNKCARELIKHDVDVNVKSKRSGKSALHLAVENDEFRGYVKLIWLLVNAGAKTDVPDENGDFPLTKVFFGAGSLPLEKHRLDALAVLLQGGADPNLRVPGTGNTPLHLAVRRQDKWAVAMLLHKGANVNAKNSSGATPLQMTANQFRGDLNHDHAQVLDLLLQAKALIDERAGALKRTALHLAILSGTAHAVKLLLDYGADPRLADKNGNTAIMLAIDGAAKVTADPDKVEDHVEVMGRLAKRLGPSWAHATTLQGVCAVEAACSENNMGLLHTLFIEGALDPRSKFRDGTVLNFVRANGTQEAKEMVELRERHMK